MAGKQFWGGDNQEFSCGPKKSEMPIQYLSGDIKDTVESLHLFTQQVSAGLKYLPGT